jgi:hypothetical protein
VACTGEVRCDDDDGGTVVATGWLGAGDGDGTARSQCVGTQGAKPCWWASNGKETGQTVAGEDRVVGRSWAREKGQTSGTRLSAEERARGRESGHN